MGRRGGRGRTLSGRAVQAFLWESVKRGTIMLELQKREKKIRMVHQRDLHSALNKLGLTDKDIQKYEGELIRAGHIYRPRAFYLKTTKSAMEEEGGQSRRKRRR